MKTTVAAFAVLFLVAMPSFTQTKTGTTAAQFLLIEPSAKITGMGNAGATTYDEIQAAYYNPLDPRVQDAIRGVVRDLSGRGFFKLLR